MDTRDYFTGFAVVASFASLLVSFRMARYNSRVKAVELKSDLLLKVSSMLRRAEGALEDSLECRKLLSRPGLEPFLHVMAPDESLVDTIARLRRFKDEQESSVGGISPRDYERYFSVVADCDERMEQVRIQKSTTKTKLIGLLSDIDAKTKSA
jgi:hypothetical protein